MTTLWTRERYVAGGGRGEVALIALTSAKLPDPLPISRTRHGMPDEGDGPGAVELVARDRAADPAWFTDAIVAPFADLIATDLGPDVAAAALAADHAYVIEVALDDPDDLGHLQAAWALAKCICEEGAAAGPVILIDVYAARAHLGVEVAALVAGRRFDVMHEVTLFFDEQEDGTLAAWTLGLRKFGRPDLVLLGLDPTNPSTATDAAVLLRDLAETLASGERIEPGDRVETPGGDELLAEPFEPARAPLVAVDNVAVVLQRRPVERSIPAPVAT
ncbi:MAG: hypothetical protein NT062_37010 [Proteobacteria bacterium]|nr:hypothetical protein [Pseudomonadota bacterium]